MHGPDEVFVHVTTRHLLIIEEQIGPIPPIFLLPI
jgi:hypothetical protein